MSYSAFSEVDLVGIHRVSDGWFFVPPLDKERSRINITAEIEKK